MEKKFTVCSALASIILISACAPTPVESIFYKYGNYTGIYNAYDNAFDSSIHWKFIKRVSGVDFIEFLNGQYPDVAPGSIQSFTAGHTSDNSQRLCEANDINTTWPRKWGACVLSAPKNDDPSCQNRNGCSTLKVSPTLLKDDRYRKWIVEALEAPCASFQDPKLYDSDLKRNYHPSGYGFFTLSVSEAWTDLKCSESTNIRAVDISIDNDTGLIKFKF